MDEEIKTTLPITELQTQDIIHKEEFIIKKQEVISDGETH